MYDRIVLLIVICIAFVVEDIHLNKLITYLQSDYNRWYWKSQCDNLAGVIKDGYIVWKPN